MCRRQNSEAEFSPRPHRTFPVSRKWPWILISRWYTAPSLYLWSPDLTPGPLHSPRDSEEASPPSAGSTGQSCATRSHRTVASGPADLATLPFWMGKFWEASAKGRGASLPPYLRHRPGRGPRESPSRWLEGLTSPQTQGQVTPNWSFHVDAVNTTVQKCNKHKAAKQKPR